ncbi:MAG TPA: hypothetical protein VK163_04240, partial [Opitutaceae bacterium]|nr:hypothetical protein [Opitutaceae bacterium]
MSLLRVSHRRRRLLPLLVALTCLLLACSAALAEARGAAWVSPLAAPGVALAGSLVLVFWLWKVHALRAGTVANELDRRWALQSRLEATLELETAESELANRQRADASQRLAARRPVLGLAWRATWACLWSAGTLLAVLLFAGLFGGGAASGSDGSAKADMKTTQPQKTEAPADEERKQLPPAPEDLTAEIRWLEPESESKATAIEEVWLKAEAETRSGLRNLTLEVNVNGERAVTIPLAPETTAPLAAPGAHTIEHGLLLDELQVQEFDIVSYHLRAEPVSRAAAPPVRSAIQFIQIRPAREDRVMCKDGGGTSPLVEALLRLKIGQLRALKENFVLTNATVARTNPLWLEHNSRVALEQRALADQTAELRMLSIKEEASPHFVARLSEIDPLMRAAADSLDAQMNDEALRQQQHALALLVDCEREIRRAAGSGQRKLEDPFRDKQKLELPPRDATPAGQVEELAQRQAELVENMRQDGAPAEQTSATQGEIAREARRMAGNSELPTEARNALERAAGAAEQSAQRMALNDPRLALAASAEAENALREAAQEIDRAGRSAALATFEAERRALNAAGRAGSAEERETGVRDTAARLAAAANAQQRTGSAAAAGQLAGAAEAVHAALGTGPGDGKWEQAAQRAAEAESALG